MRLFVVVVSPDRGGERERAVARSSERRTECLNSPYGDTEKIIITPAKMYTTLYNSYKSLLERIKRTVSVTVVGPRETAAGIGQRLDRNEWGAEVSTTAGTKVRSRRQGSPGEGSP